MSRSRWQTELLFGELTRGGVVYVDIDKAGENLAFRFKEAKAPAKKPRKGKGPDQGSAERKVPEFVE